MHAQDDCMLSKLIETLLCHGQVYWAFRLRNNRKVYHTREDPLYQEKSVLSLNTMIWEGI